MPSAATYRSVLKHFNASSDPVKWYFDQVPSLLPNYPYEVTLAYLFLRTERAQNRALYCGVVKLHRASGTVADAAVSAQYLTRDGFIDLYKNVFGHDLPKTTRVKIKKAEKIRDRVIHGKDVSEASMREAIVDVLEYAEALNSDLDRAAGFKPFGDLRGFKGRGQPLDNSTSRWLLKGLGFSIA